MKKQLLDELGKAAYEARKASLATGVYTDHAARVPNSLNFYEWDEIPDRLESPVQWLYRKEAQGVLDAFFMYVFENGTEEAQQALRTLLKASRDIMLTDDEIISDEESRRQQ